VPHRFVISEKLLANDEVEYRGRGDSESSVIQRDAVMSKLSN